MLNSRMAEQGGISVDPKDRASQILQFGVFELDLTQGELRKHGRKIKLQERPFQLLAALLERPGQVITREELARKLWIDTTVDFDNGLNIAAKKVREALDDDAATPRYVETLPRRGYRFIAPVQVRSMVAAAAAAEEKLRPEPEVIVPVATGEPAPPIVPARLRPPYGRIAALLVVLFFAARIYWLATGIKAPHVAQVVQLTQTGRAEYSDGVATDGSRVYFTEREGGRWSLAQVSVQGGNPQPLPVQVPNPDILDISPDHNSLLISGGSGVEPDRSLWVIPTVGGSPRRLGDVTGRAGAWSRDAGHVVFARGTALYRVNSDGTDIRKLLDAPGGVNWIRWSPAPQKELLRFPVLGMGAKPSTLWEAAADGTGMHRLLPEWNPATQATDGDDDGTWTATGKYFLFRSLRAHVASVWAMRENRTFPRNAEGPPVQIYSSPMQFTALAPSPDGRRVFFAAGQERRELVRYNSGRKQFLPFLSDVAARWATFSKDGQWVAYVTVPDGTLWRSHPDGSERLQLTPPSFTARQPQWSPDGSLIVFTGGPAGQSSKVYAIAATGGAPEEITREPFVDFGASWSPDGSSLVFARTVPAGTAGQPGLYVMDWKTKNSVLLPGSEDLAEAAWSPDGRSIAATNRERTEIVLMDLATRKWTPLASGVGLGVPFWSRDGKSVFYQEEEGSVEQPIFRVSIGKGRKEQTMSSKQIPQFNAVGYLLVGLAPDDAPIAAVIHTNSDVYALDVELP